MRRVGIDVECRAWLERLLGGCDRAIARLEERDDADRLLASDNKRLQAEVCEDRAAGQVSAH